MDSCKNALAAGAFIALKNEGETFEQTYSLNCDI